MPFTIQPRPTVSDSLSHTRISRTYTLCHTVDMLSGKDDSSHITPSLGGVIRDNVTVNGGAQAKQLLSASIAALRCLKSVSNCVFSDLKLGRYLQTGSHHYIGKMCKEH